MAVSRAIINTIEGKEIVVEKEVAIPCFRCGLCCMRYQPVLHAEDIDDIVSALDLSKGEFISKYAEHAPIREGYLLRRGGRGCVFLAWDETGRARCPYILFVLRLVGNGFLVYPGPNALRDWLDSNLRDS